MKSQNDAEELWAQLRDSMEDTDVRQSVCTEKVCHLLEMSITFPI